MLLNTKLNDTAQKILWKEAVHMFKRVNSMDTTGSTTSPFKIFYREKPNIIGLFSEFGPIGYVTKQDKFKNKITYKISKAIMVGCTSNHTRNTYKLYNPETKRVILTRDVKWAD